MFTPNKIRRLVHSATDAEDRITQPFRVGLTNTLAATFFMALAGTYQLYKYREHLDRAAWWVWIAVPVAVGIIAFGHAYLGALIGGKLANNIFVIGLLVVMIGGLWLLMKYMVSL